MRDLQTQLQRRREGKVKGGKAPTLDSVKKQIHTSCSAQFVEKILKTEVQQTCKSLELTFRTDQAALEKPRKPILAVCSHMFEVYSTSDDGFEFTIRWTGAAGKLDGYWV